MSQLILVLGESGTGKSTSIRTLNPEQTFILNVLHKPLPFRGYRNLYSEEKKNYLDSDEYSKIIGYVKAINERRLEIKSIIIDDFSFLMSNQYMRRCREKNFDKFVDIGANAFELLDYCKSLREDLCIFIMCHTDQDHAGMIKPKTVGKMVSEHVCLGERVTICLHSQVIDGQYKFLTNHNGVHFAKSPHQMFDDLYIDNDLQYVKEKMQEYFNEGR